MKTYFDMPFVLKDSGIYFITYTQYYDTIFLIILIEYCDNVTKVVNNQQEKKLLNI